MDQGTSQTPRRQRQDSKKRRRDHHKQSGSNRRGPPQAAANSRNSNRSSTMAPPISLRFLGTSSAPSMNRNYSSLLVKIGSEAVMVDCGEGTQQRLMRFNNSGIGRLNAIKTILITHLHADHVLGLVPMLHSMAMSTSPSAQNDTRPHVEIFGPLGLRSLIRTQLHLCYSTLNLKYAVHELIWPSQRQQTSSTSSSGPDRSPSDASSSYTWLEPDTPMPGAIMGPQRVIPILPTHESELPGRDIVMDDETCTWRSFTSIPGDVKISAAPILHRVPTLAYVFEEPPAASSLPPDTVQRLDANAEGLLARDGIRHPRSLLGRLIKDRHSVSLPDGTEIHPPALNKPGRKITVCGDTYDASGGFSSNDQKGLVPLAKNSTLLVHECTNASLSPHLMGNTKKVQSQEEVREKAESRGHSIPQVAGTFAGKIAAQAVLLNHFSVRYFCPSNEEMTRYWPGSNQEEGRPVEINLSSKGKNVQPGFERTNAGKMAILDDIASQTTLAWHASMPSREEIERTITADETTKIRAAMIDGWKRRRAIPTWDGFEYSVFRDDELLHFKEANLQRAM
ncbi:unnamed protein product [Sympodiomycopsis kandeliae]